MFNVSYECTGGDADVDAGLGIVCSVHCAVQCAGCSVLLAKDEDLAVETG